MRIDTMDPLFPQWQCDGCGEIFEWYEFNPEPGADEPIQNMPAFSGGMAETVYFCEACLDKVGANHPESFAYEEEIYEARDALRKSTTRADGEWGGRRHVDPMSDAEWASIIRWLRARGYKYPKDAAAQLRRTLDEGRELSGTGAMWHVLRTAVTDAPQ